MKRNGSHVNRSLGDLPAPRRRLIELMQQVNFGRIEGLVVEGSQPVLDPPPRVVYEVKFGAENGPRPELQTRDYLLKRQVVELFLMLDELGNGTIDLIEIKHGLPFRMLFGVAAA